MIWQNYRFKALAGLVLTPLLSFHPALASPGDEHSSHHAAMSGTTETTRTIEVIARDIEFSVSEIDVRQGETVRFVIRNEGELDHDFTIGDANTQAAHRAEMQAMMSGMSDGHSHMHKAANAVMIAPGTTAELLWTFGEDTSVQFGCNVPGHFESGMAGKFDVQS